MEAKFLEAITDFPDHAVSMADAEGRVVFMNNLAHQLMAMPVRTTKDYKLKAPFGVFLPDRKTPVPFEDYPTMRALRGDILTQVLRWVRLPGVPKGMYIRSSAFPICDAAGKIVGAVSLWRPTDEKVPTA